MIMEETKRKLFDIFRPSSRASQTKREFSEPGPSSHGTRPRRSIELEQDQERVHRKSRKRDISQAHQEQHKTDKLRSISPDSSATPQEFRSSESTSSEWPPEHLTPDDELMFDEAKALILPGVPIFKGIKRSIPYASDRQFALYAVCDEGPEDEDDRAPFFKKAFSAVTLQLSGRGIALNPWDSLEQPSGAFIRGNRSGTITLNHWASLQNLSCPFMELKDTGYRPKQVKLTTIVDRLIYLEGGLEEEEELMYKNLYGTFLKDPDKYFNPHKAMEKQITDLIVVLSLPTWIDFSNQRNQTVGKFFFDASLSDEGRYHKFFHQLVLSMELDLRINEKHHADVPKQRLISQLPPRVAWSLAVARRWQECVSLQLNRGNIKLKFVVKRRQIKALLRFAQEMKWPNLAEVEKILQDRNMQLEEFSSDAMSYFSGVILPGTSLPWLVMNSLIDCDSGTGAPLSSLSYRFPNSGFQYRGTTYWSSHCVVGKVLAPTCQEIAGWIGPLKPVSDLNQSQIARIHQRKPRQQMSVKEVESMSARSDPLGPPTRLYPVKEFQVVLPVVENVPDTIRIENVILKAVLLNTSDERSKDDQPPLFDACIQFAIGGHSWPLRLAFDVSFICAFPCRGAPHPLFYDYTYTAVRVNEILAINDWGGLISGSNTDALNQRDIEKVLVVEAFGIPDNEVLARAYCAHWGLSAIVGNIENTCCACAIREAYAACLNVVILVNTVESETGV